MKELKVGHEDNWLDEIDRDREECFSWDGESPAGALVRPAAGSGLAGTANVGFVLGPQAALEGAGKVQATG